MVQYEIKEIMQLLEMIKESEILYCFHRDEMDECIIQLGGFHILDPELVVVQNPKICKEKEGKLLVAEKNKAYDIYLTVEDTYRKILEYK